MQEKVRRFVKEYNLECSESIRYMDLVSEVGELGKEIIKSTDYGSKSYKNTEEATEEMGDCIFSMMALCCEMGIDAEGALEQAINKYQIRFSDKGNIGSGR